jgi:hypothetical protein
MKDEFFLSDDDLRGENELTEVEKAMINVIDILKKKIDLLKETIEMKQTSEVDSLVTVVLRYVGAVSSIKDIGNNPEMKEEDKLEEIDKILMTTKELDFFDIKQKEEKSQEVKVDESDDDSNNDLGF